MRTPDNAAAYMLAINALRSDLAHLEQEAAQVRALLDGLERRACITGSPAAAPGEPAVPSSATSRPILPLSGSKERTYTTKHGSKPKTAVPANARRKRASSPVTGNDSSEDRTYQRNPDDQAALGKWENALAAIAAAAADVAAAVRDRDPEKIEKAVAARARAQRHAGELLLSWNGRVAPLPGAATVHARRLCRAAAKMSAADFEEDVHRQQRAALAAIGIAPAKPTRTPPAAPMKPELVAPVAEWLKVLASRADAIAEAESAARDKDATKLRAAIAERANLERAAGQILTAINGRVRPLPGGTTENDRERWKSLAQMSVPKFENALRQWQHRALAAIGVEPEKPAPKAKPSPPKPTMKVSPWRVGPDGTRSRILTAVDGSGGAEATS
jgi:hypothetical protein